MKLTIVGLLALAAVAVGLTAIFRPGDEYVYHYRGHILTGVQKSSRQYSGFLVDSKVTLQFQTGNTVFMKMSEIKVYKINNLISKSPVDMLSDDEMTRLTGEDSQIIVKYLVKPTKFRYIEGEIRHLEKERDDPYWSLNMKKGVLSLLQISLKERTGSFDSTVDLDPIMARRNLRVSARSSNPLLSYRTAGKISYAYKVMETDVLGECETKYVVLTDKTSTSTSSVSDMFVTAARNFDNCVTTPFDVAGIFAGIYGNPEERPMILPVVHTEYVLSGDRDHFLVKDVKLRGKYHVRPHGLDGGDITGYTYLTLTLTNTRTISSAITLNSPTAESSGLKMVIPTSKIIEKDDHMTELDKKYEPRNLRYPTTTRTYDDDDDDNDSTNDDGVDETPALKKHLSDMISCVYTTAKKECSWYVIRLTRTMTDLSKNEMKNVLLEYLNRNSADDYRKSEILLDILPTLPTPNAAKVLLELIGEKKIKPMRASIMVNVMSTLVKPVPSVIKSTLKLYKEMSSIDNRKTLDGKTALTQSLLLGVGILTHRLNMIMRDHGKQIPEVLRVVETVIREMKQLLERSCNDHETILVLKSIGNLGSIQTLPILRPIIDNRKLPIIVRTNAVYAMRRITRFNYKMAGPIALGIFMNVDESPEVRIAAYVVLRAANPGYTTLQMIAHRLRSEQSSQVHSFVYCDLVTIVRRSTEKPENSLLANDFAKNIRLAMKMIRPFPVGIRDSLSVGLFGFLEKYDVGGSFDIMKIKSRMSGLPQALVAKLQMSMFGKHRTVLLGGVEGKALESLVDHLVGPYGLLKNILKSEASIFDILKPFVSTGTSGIQGKIREILTKMSYVSGFDEKLFGTWFLQIFGHELQFMAFNSESVEDLGRSVLSRLPDMLSELKNGHHVDILKTIHMRNSLVISSPFGIPITLNQTTVGIFKLEGQVTVNRLPSWSEIYSGKWHTKLDGMVDVKPYVEVSVLTGLGVDMRWLSAASGLKMYANLERPIKAELTVDPNDLTLDIKCHLPKKNMENFNSLIEPFSLIKYTPTNPNTLPFKFEYKIRTMDDIVKTIPISWTYRCKVTGVEFTVIGQYAKCGPIWCPFFPMYGRHELVVTTRPTLDAVDYIQYKMKALTSLLDSSSSSSSSDESDGVSSSNSSQDESNSDSSSDDTDSSSSSSSEETTQKDRRSRTTDAPDGEFDPVTPDPILTNPIKRQVLVSVGTNKVNDWVKAKVTWFISRKYWNHQWNVQMMSHIPNDFVKKVKLNSVVNLLAWNSSSTTDILSKMSLSWWMPTNEENNVKVKIIPGSVVRISDELRQHGIEPSENMRAHATKYTYTMNVEFLKMSRMVTKWTTKALDLLKYKFFNKVTVSIPIDPPTNKILVVGEFLPWWETMTLVVKTPRETDYVVEVPFYWNPFLPKYEKINVHDFPATAAYTADYHPVHTSDVSGNYQIVTPTGQCSYSRSHWTTFDGVRYTSQMSHPTWNKACSLLITQDCHGSQLFSMVGEGSLNSGTIKISLKDHELKVVLRDDGKLHFVLDGTEKPVSTLQPLVSKTGIRVGKVDSNRYEFTYRPLGLKVVFMPLTSDVHISLSPHSTLQGKLCGLCGNFNYDHSDDLVIPGSKYPNLPLNYRYILSHIIPTPSCEGDHILLASGRNDDDQTRNAYVTAKTVTLKRLHNDVMMTCTSNEPIASCSTNCRAEGTVRRKYCFTCAPMEGEDAESVTADGTEDKECKGYFEYVDHPIICKPNAYDE